MNCYSAWLFCFRNFCLHFCAFLSVDFKGICGVKGHQDTVMSLSLFTLSRRENWGRLLLGGACGEDKAVPPAAVGSGFGRLAASSLAPSLSGHTSVLPKVDVPAKSCFGNRPNRTEDRRGTGRDHLTHTSLCFRQTGKNHETTPPD